MPKRKRETKKHNQAYLARLDKDSLCVLVLFLKWEEAIYLVRINKYLFGMLLLFVRTKVAFWKNKDTWPILCLAPENREALVFSVNHHLCIFLKSLQSWFGSKVAFGDHILCMSSIRLVFSWHKGDRDYEMDISLDQDTESIEYMEEDEKSIITWQEVEKKLCGNEIQCQFVVITNAWFQQAGMSKTIQEKPLLDAIQESLGMSKLGFDYGYEMEIEFTIRIH